MQGCEIALEKRQGLAHLIEMRLMMFVGLCAQVCLFVYVFYISLRNFVASLAGLPGDTQLPRT